MNTIYARSTVRVAIVSLLAGALAAVLPAYAHHSFPAQYDESNPIELTGIKKW